jgi:hypothetical protein
MTSTVDQATCRHTDLRETSPGIWHCEQRGTRRHVVPDGLLHKQWRGLTGRAATGQACVICNAELLSAGRDAYTVGRKGRRWVFSCEGQCYATASASHRR